MQAAFPDGAWGKPVRKPVRAGGLSSGPAVRGTSWCDDPTPGPAPAPAPVGLPSSRHFGLKAAKSVLHVSLPACQRPSFRVAGQRPETRGQPVSAHAALGGRLPSTKSPRPVRGARGGPRSDPRPPHSGDNVRDGFVALSSWQEEGEAAAAEAPGAPATPAPPSPSPEKVLNFPEVWMALGVRASLTDGPSRVLV